MKDHGNEKVKHQIHRVDKEREDQRRILHRRMPESRSTQAGGAGMTVRAILFITFLAGIFYLTYRLIFT
jgi:hypothetical protein